MALFRCPDPINNENNVFGMKVSEKISKNSQFFNILMVAMATG
jgi:hypothetical protein